MGAVLVAGDPKAPPGDVETGDAASMMTVAGRGLRGKSEWSSEWSSEVAMIVDAFPKLRSVLWKGIGVLVG